MSTTKQRREPAPITRKRPIPEPDALATTPNPAASAALDSEQSNEPELELGIDPERHSEPEPQKEPEPAKKNEPAKSAGKRSKPAAKKKQQTVNFDVDVLERARSAAFHLAAYVPKSEVQSIADIVHNGVTHELERLEREYNKGRPFRKVGTIPPGRRRKQTHEVE